VTPSGQAAKAHIFLDVPEDEVDATARRLFGEAVAAVGEPAAVGRLGQIHPLARSFAIEADPRVLAEIGRSAAVRDVLPSEIDDILPRPSKDGEPT